jgi:translation initiation factor IF-2
MSIRIHQLSKKIGMDNKVLVTLLQERGYHVTSASSTIDNISADSLVQEFAGHVATAQAEPAEAAAEAETETAPEVKEEKPAPPPPPKLPEGVFVKSREQIEEERREREAARAPVRSAPMVAPTPTFRVPPSPRTVRTSPAPITAPAAVPPSRPAAVAPPPVARPSPPPMSPPVAPKAAGSPLPPPALAGPGSPPAPPSMIAPVAAAAPAPAAGEGDDVKVIQIKPPIVVRDFATMLGLKPFKLISELMEMGIFAALNPEH